MLSQMVKLLIFDLLVILAGIVLLGPLSRYKHAAFAVLKRNFVGYFSNPTGYVFLCLFVLLSSFAAFWPHEFFNANLATLSQLNFYFPYIMLVFIPAITMSIWAEERRQGTDELLLTIPADDLDIVLGKYLAAAAIFTASLLFSQLSNFAVLNALALGDVDLGLFISTYVGYWLIGLAMLAVGMVASFLTSNLTVGFILGAVFNAPLTFAASADAIIPFSGLARAVSHWSYSEQFADFGRGVFSLASVTYFVMIIVVGVYLSVVLIGRRHWLGGRDGQSMLGHFVVRTLALVLFAVGTNLYFTHNDLIRWDATSERVSSLSPDTIKLLRGLQPTHPISIEAFISGDVPEPYAKTKVDLISMLNEFRAAGGAHVNVRIYDDLEPFGEDAARAEEQYGIKPETVLTRERGAFKQSEIFLGAAFTSGLEKVVVPFFDHGIPVEYELIRSICTVAQEQRRKVGVIRTDAELFGGFDFARMTTRPKQLIIEELEKQYEVVEVDPNNPIEDSFDVLLAVQPSSLTQPQLDNVLEAIRRGTPTAVFEDPFPVALTTAPGTGQPKRPQGGPMGFGGPPEQKGDIQRLWSLLGLELVGQDGMGGYDAEIIWQDYNPYPKVRGFRQITPEWVFVGPDAPGAQEPLNPADAITSNLKQLLFLFPGAVESRDGKGVSFVPLVTTGLDTGTISFQDLTENQDNPLRLNFSRRPRNRAYTLAARIQGTAAVPSTPAADQPGAAPSEAPGPQAPGAAAGTPAQTPPASQSPLPEDLPASTEGTESQDDNPAPAASSSPAAARERKIDVVFVTDIDLMHSDFLRLRARPDGEINWQFDNVTFVLNVLDTLAGDQNFVEIRKRQTRHSTLKMVELRTENAREEANLAIRGFEDEFNKAQKDAEGKKDKASEELQKIVDQLREKARAEGKVNSRELESAIIRLAMKQRVAERRLESETERLRRERDRKLKLIERDLDLQIIKVQNEFKFWAVILPPIPPLLVGLFVFRQRRAREKEGVSRDRLR